MSRIRQILRCYRAGNSSRTISNVLEISRNTVKKYIDIVNESGKTFDEVLAMEDHELYKFFNEDPRRDADCSSDRYKELKELLPSLAKKLRKKGMTKTQLYEEYLREHPGGFSRSRFLGVLRGYTMQTAPVAHLEHKAGDKMYIDYAGDKLHITDPETGELIPVEVFVAILPCSQLTYVEAVMSQKKEDLIKGCENALYFYGGVPQVIVPDNLKAAVSHPSKYESILNDDFASFADHYGIAVMPARVRKPRDKALVEGAVKLIYRSIYPLLEGRQFFCLDDLNSAIRTALEIHNNANLTGKYCSRRDQFEEMERSALSPINPVRFEIKRHHEVTVARNGHIRLEKHYYSVPVKLIGNKVQVIYDTRTVNIFHKYNLVATHPFSTKPYCYTTNPEHLPASQRGFIDQNMEEVLKQASAMSNIVHDYLVKVIESKPYPELAFKSCKGILSLGKKVGTERLNNACIWAGHSELYSYQAIESILKNRQDKLPLEEFGIDAEMEEIKHENIRGKEYYK